MTYADEALIQSDTADDRMIQENEAKMAKIGESLGFPGRIDRDDWAGQAKALMEAKK